MILIPPGFFNENDTDFHIIDDFVDEKLEELRQRITTLSAQADMYRRAKTMNGKTKYKKIKRELREANIEFSRYIGMPGY